MQYKLKLTKFQKELVEKYLPNHESLKGKWLLDGSYLYLVDKRAGLDMFDAVSPDLWGEHPRKKGGRREHARATWTMLYKKFMAMEPDPNLQKEIEQKKASWRPCDCGVEYVRVAPLLVWCPECKQHLQIDLFGDLFNSTQGELE